MKVCNNCGASLNDNAAFCTNCGSTVPAAGYSPAAPQMIAKQPISVGGWIGRSLIPYIPIVGALVYLIMLFVWSGDTVKEETFRNWAKAQLIVIAIVLGLSIVFGIIFGIAFADVFAEATQHMY